MKNYELSSPSMANAYPIHISTSSYIESKFCSEKKWWIKFPHFSGEVKQKISVSLVESILSEAFVDSDVKKKRDL